MTSVIKRNGRRQRFNQDKLRHSIAAAANEADIPVGRCMALVEEASRKVRTEMGQKKEISAFDLRLMILAILDKAEPRVARSWRDYDREAKGLA